MLYKAPKGTRDILTDESFKWQFIESKIREICHLFGVYEIRTPMFESTELFLRGVGEVTDIVQKEMYTFLDKGNRSMTLRPEGTAPTVRAFIENSMYANPQPTKLFYINQTFRYEEPQSGRYRQFSQFGVELFGASDSFADAEVISIVRMFLHSLGLKNISLHINSLGCPNCRPAFIKVLEEYIWSKHDLLCKTCKERIKVNPLRVLDCKELTCSEIMEHAPVCLEYLDEECLEHFEKLQELLIHADIPFIIDPEIVRGLDYYTKTVFELKSNDIGAQSTICGGGRYDNLISMCGGPETPAVGFAVGLERLLIAINALEIETGIEKPGIDIYVGHMGERGKIKANVLVNRLRAKGISAEADIVGRSVKAQMKYANKIGAKEVLIIGDNEIDNDKASLKNMETGESKDICLSEYS